MPSSSPPLDGVSTANGASSGSVAAPPSLSSARDLAAAYLTAAGHTNPGELLAANGLGGGGRVGGSCGVGATT